MNLKRTASPPPTPDSAKRARFSPGNATFNTTISQQMSSRAHPPKEAPARRRHERDPDSEQVYAVGTVEDEEVQEDEDYLAAMAYLEDVRQQARTMPDVFVAARDEKDHEKSDEEDEMEEQQGGGFYFDGVYMANPRMAAASEHLESEDGEAGEDEDYDGAYYITASEAYHEAFLRRYQLHRSELATPPPPHVLSRLPRLKCLHIINSWKFTREAFVKTKPHPAQLAAMDSAMALRAVPLLIQLLTRIRLFLKEKQRECLTLWIWGVLGRLPPPGSLVAEEIASIRVLGKKAVSIILELEKNPIYRYPQEGKDEDEGNVEVQLGDSEDSADGMLDEEEPVQGKADQGKAGQVKAGQGKADQEKAGHGMARFGNARMRRNTSSPLSEASDEGGSQPAAAGENALENSRVRLLQRISNIEGVDEQLTRDNIAQTSTKDAINKPSTLTSDEHAAFQGAYATLDMVLTVVGEFYGQRDLLVARERLWDMDGSH